MTDTPVVLGIDPGLNVCGWGVVRGGARPSFIAGGVVRPKKRDGLARRLLTLYEAFVAQIEAHRPDAIAVEDPFVGALAPASALAIGQARAVALLAGAQAGIEAFLYAPAAVKAAVSGYGASDKRQVQSMVRLLLGLDADPEPADAADALAVALCHLSNRALEQAISKAMPRRSTPKRTLSSSTTL